MSGSIAASCATGFSIPGEPCAAKVNTYRDIATYSCDIGVHVFGEAHECL
jgi:hypothetical protein